MAHCCTVFVAWILIQCFDRAWSWEALVVKSLVFARAGSPVELPCSYSTYISHGFTLEWRYAAPGTPAIQAERVLYYNGKLYWVHSWESRMVLVQNPPVSGLASVKILSVQPSDGGLYICDVTNPNDWTGSGQGLINLTVLVAPSVPVCQLTGSTYTGDDVTLTCHSSEGFPTPVYSWSRETGSAPLPPSSVVEDRHTGSLILTNLSATFAGTYICKASNDLGVAACSIAVKVAHGGAAEVVGGVLMGVFLLVLLIGAVTAYFLCYRKRPRRHANALGMSLDPSGQRQSKGRLLSRTLSDDHPQHLRVSHFSPLV
ncbi:V-set and immunoglobulin domain-containing protein 2-like [Electrophorus electricus]|uniref:V-set and immunoglobulin domain-containing protein 2-like n=1 Tax=Electrophorus electricus TaxID=8005 RepID=UPI0015D02234|nr:V-set and immunoglobulin domain-containing protein 2-like [Electrophorus electricus]